MEQRGRKHFEVGEVRRTPVTLTPEAKEAIDASSQQGRLFPQALAEAFGTLAGVSEVRIHAVPRSTHFACSPEDYHPQTGEETARILEIDARATDEQTPLYRWHINMRELEEAHGGHASGFRAQDAATELLRLYPYRVHREKEREERCDKWL